MSRLQRKLTGMFIHGISEEMKNRRVHISTSAGSPALRRVSMLPTISDPMVGWAVAEMRFNNTVSTFFGTCFFLGTQSNIMLFAVITARIAVISTRDLKSAADLPVRRGRVRDQVKHCKKYSYENCSFYLPDAKALFYTIVLFYLSK